MSVMKGCMIAAVALAAGAIVESARADEAYICDGGRVAYVKPGELESKKLNDPCIAKYFEQTTAAKPPAPAVAPVAPIADATIAKARLAEPMNDFRNVRIINASPGSDGWFRLRN